MACVNGSLAWTVHASHDRVDGSRLREMAASWTVRASHERVDGSRLREMAACHFKVEGLRASRPWTLGHASRGWRERNEAAAGKVGFTKVCACGRPRTAREVR